MTKRDLFNSVVAEVTRDSALVLEFDRTDIEEGSGMEILQDLELETPTSAFADYDVRDALLLEGCKDEKFAFVLNNKIIRTTNDASTRGTFNQGDMEALAVAIHLQAMWEQQMKAIAGMQIADLCAEAHGVEVPSLIPLTKRMMLSSAMGMDFEETRKGAVEALAQKAQEGLDSE